jgi:hypothetical protein
VRVVGQRHAPAALPLGKSPGIYCPGGWVDPTAGLDGCREDKISYYALGCFRTATSRYTDYAIPAANELFYTLKFGCLYEVGVVEEYEQRSVL